MTRLTNIISLSLIFLASALPVSAQEMTKIDQAEKQSVIDSVSSLLNDNYVFPDVAKEMTKLIQDKHKQGKYAAIDLAQKFAEQLTEDLRSISNDLHLRVRFAPEQIAMMRAHAEQDEEETPQEWIDQMKRNNYGFKEVKIIDGNVGYLDLRGFNNTRYAGETAVAAMNFLSNADALIIDLRQNGGGSPSMIQLITSYLYDAEPVHLNNFYWRPSDEHTQTWTLPHVSGTRRPDIDVYVLTSRRTFSAAEEFSYNLRNLERATLVGETTGGGAHPGGTHIATDRFTVWVPQGRAINPITETNWEGTGVKPHVEVPAADALETAHLLALEKMAEKAETEEEKERISWIMGPMEAKKNPLKVAPEVLQSYAGKYGPRTITYKDGQLFYKREGSEEHPLIALEEDLFYFEEASYFRLQILKEDGEVIGLKGLYDNGNTDISMKDSAPRP